VEHDRMNANYIHPSPLFMWWISTEFIWQVLEQAKNNKVQHPLLWRATGRVGCNSARANLYSCNTPHKVSISISSQQRKPLERWIRTWL